MTVVAVVPARAEIDILTPAVYDEIFEHAGVAQAEIKKYEQIFDLIEKGDFTAADKQVADLENPIILGHVLAEKYLHAKYKSRVEELEDWLAMYSELPQAPRIYKLAKRKGADLPEFVSADDKTPSNKISRKYLERLSRGNRRSHQQK